ncbi:MAG: type II secretion system F family protein [Planctomycetaceae bacterium]|jgi:type II secretory pathway component PulF|nr:type II secretion system F family protein [Planctomycetaceae bacterium]
MPHLSNFDHGAWCRRVGISLSAGLDIVSILQREAGEMNTKMEHIPGIRNLFTRPEDRPEDPAVTKEDLWKMVAEKVENGSSFQEALKSQRNYFPRLLIAMVGVGEESGRLPEMLTDLAGYYDMLSKMKHAFWRSVTWPLFQLGAALVFLGFLILFLGFFNSMTGKEIDPLRLGLFGVRGLCVYLLILAVPAMVIFAVYRFFRANITQGVRWLQYKLDCIPRIQSYFRNAALARLTMSMNLTTRTGMDIRRSLKLSFEAAAFAPVTDKLPEVLKNLEQGQTLCQSVPVTEFFDQHFFLFLRAGEESGNLPAAMKKLSDDYFDRAKFDLKFLSVVAYFIVYGVVAMILICLIFRGYGAYLEDCFGMASE